MKQLVDNLQRKSVEVKTSQSRKLQMELQHVQTQLELTRFLAAPGSPGLPEVVTEMSAIIMNSNRETGRLLAAVLNKSGLKECRVYSGPETAAAHFSGVGPVDIVVSEWTGESGKGKQLLQSIRSMPVLSPKPVFIANCFTDKLDEIEKTLDAGVDEYLLMPFKTTDLIDQIATAITNRTSYGSDEAMPDISGYKALIVNQDTTAISRIHEILVAEGIKKTRAVKTGAAAISLLRNETFSLVFYDNRIVDPHWNLFHDELKLKKIADSPFIMIVTGQANQKESIDNTEVGAPIAALTEPYSQKRVQQVLKQFFVNNETVVRSD